MDRAEIVHEAFLLRVARHDLPAGSARRLAEAGLDSEAAAALFRAQVTSRQLDRTSRKMQARKEGFYTIGSSGHEGMAAVAAALRPDDMAFLHYRDAAFLLQRMSQVHGSTPVRDFLLSFAAASEDPISGGRHKVLGSKRLFVPPQTSTIASHLPKALGAAFSIELARRNPPEHKILRDDGIILCSFGDASLNHSTAQGALNTAGWTAWQRSPLPLLFVCEDNGIGISTHTPAGWVEASVRSRPGLTYFAADGLDFVETLAVARDVVDHVRRQRRPAFLHLRTVRLFGHAGSDVEMAYLSRAEIEENEANDPLLRSAATLIEQGVLTSREAIALYEAVGAQAEAVSRDVAARPKLATADEVMAALVPPPRPCRPSNGPFAGAREQAFGAELKMFDTAQPMARLLNWALTDLMLQHPEIVVAGEDVGPKGGVYGVTQRLHARFGSTRVINTLLDEQAILGLAIGLGHNGFVAMPEIQFLAYLHNAEDQLRGEAATLSFFSDGQFTNPMVIRIAGLGYQKGFGGHFHNDNSIAVLRDIPGLIIACPSNGADAVAMLRESVRLAREEQRVVVFVEPIALYMTRDLHEEKDGLWSFVYPPPGLLTPFDQVGVRGDGVDLAIVSYGNGHYLACQAARRLEREHGIAVRNIDLRWLAPLPVNSLLAAIAPCGAVLVVDECRTTGSQSEAVVALLLEQGGRIARRIAADDSFIATGPAYAATLPSIDGIVAAALAAVGRDA